MRASLGYFLRDAWCADKWPWCMLMVLNIASWVIVLMLRLRVFWAGVDAVCSGMTSKIGCGVGIGFALGDGVTLGDGITLGGGTSFGGGISSSSSLLLLLSYPGSSCGGSSGCSVVSFGCVAVDFRMCWSRFRSLSFVWSM